jgi:hypothetical protein
VFLDTFLLEFLNFFFIRKCLKTEENAYIWLVLF